MSEFFRIAILLFSLLFVTAAQAQQQGAVPSPATPAGTAAQSVAPAEAQDALIKLLEDPQGRAALIQQLRNLKTGQASPESVVEPGHPDGSDPAVEDEAIPDTSPQPVTRDQSFALKLGEYTQIIADDLVAMAGRVRHALSGIPLLLDGTIKVQWDRIWKALLEIGAVLAVAMVLFKAGQWVRVALFRQYDASVRYGGWLLRGGLLLLTTAADALTVAIGWSGGYAVALFAMGPLGSGISLLESLALNAFLLTGLTKVALRFVFAPDRAMLRLLPFDDDAAIYWNRWLGFVVAWLGYGIMLMVPVANVSISFVVGNAVRFLVIVAAAAILLVLIRINHNKVKQGIHRYADTLSSELAIRFLHRFAGLWSVVAWGYVLVVLIVWLSRPFDAVAIIMRSTGLSILTIMGGMLISLVMTRAITGGVRLSPNLRQSLPALEGRLNAFVPRILKIVRVIVFATSILILLDIWGVIHFLDWAQNGSGAQIISRYGAAAMVLLVSFMVWLAVMSWIDLRLRDRVGYVVTSRERTLFQLFRNAFTVVIIVMGSLLALSEIGIDIGPLIAGAGVIGLAVSFGAQTLVKDIITGAFIQIENAINEGDVVTVGGITGSVERLTVRSVRLRDLDGTTHIVPFSSVDMVSNFMRDFSYHVAVMGVAYDTDIRKAKAAMEEAFRRLKETEFGTKIIADLEMHGVTNFGDSAIDIRARIKTLPGEQWGVGRAYNEFVKDVFDEEGIEIPFPQVTYHSATPPATEALTAQKSKAGPKLAQLEDDAPPDVDH